MIHVSFNLPAKRRLDLRFVKRRKSFDDKPLLPDLGKIRRAKKGNKLSRFFRLIFEHKKIKRFFGTNLAILVIATSFLPINEVESVETEEKIITEAPVVLTTEKGVQYPVENVKISQGYRVFHPGLDLDGLTGEAIYPVMGGRVKAVGYSRLGYGNAILVNHGNEITSLYAHLSNIEVEEGQEIATSTKIGEMGATGSSSGDHLHLEIHDHGYPINPYSVLPAR